MAAVHGGAAPAAGSAELIGVTLSPGRGPRRIFPAEKRWGRRVLLAVRRCRAAPAVSPRAAISWARPRTAERPGGGHSRRACGCRRASAAAVVVLATAGWSIPYEASSSGRWPPRRRHGVGVVVVVGAAADATPQCRRRPRTVTPRCPRRPSSPGRRGSDRCCSAAERGPRPRTPTGSPPARTAS